MTVFSYEDFEQAPLDSSDTTAPSADYLRGFEAGLQQAATEKAEDQTRLTDALVSALQDLEFTRADARTHILTQVRGVLDAVLSILLPMPLEEGFSPRTIDRLIDVCASCSDDPIRIAAHPDDIRLLGLAVPGLGPEGFTFQPDAGLRREQFLISTDAQETLIDHAALRDRIAAIFAALPTDRKEHANGG